MNCTVTIEGEALKFNPPLNYSPEDRTTVATSLKTRLAEIVPSPVVEPETPDSEVVYAELPLLMSDWDAIKAKAKLAPVRLHLSQGVVGYLANLPV
jgi:hypothetical protein